VDLWEGVPEVRKPYWTDAVRERRLEGLELRT
jgi:hypothetical protein